MQELHNHCDDPTPVLSPVPQDKPEVEPVFDVRKSMADIGRAAYDNLNLLGQCCERSRCSWYGTRKNHRGGL